MGGYGREGPLMANRTKIVTAALMASIAGAAALGVGAAAADTAESGVCISDPAGLLGRCSPNFDGNRRAPEQGPTWRVAPTAPLTFGGAS